MDTKFYEIIRIVKSDTNKNRITKKDEKFHVCLLKEIYSIDPATGRKFMSSGITTGKTFLEKENGAWVEMLNEVEAGKMKESELPLFQGYVADVTVDPYYVPERGEDGKIKKAEDGSIVIAKYPTGHPDEGKDVIANRFHMLLSADENLETATNNFMSRQKKVDLATVDASACASDKAKTILSVVDLIAKPTDEEGAE